MKTDKPNLAHFAAPTSMTIEDEAMDERRRGYDQAILEGIRARLIEIQSDQKDLKRSMDDVKSTMTGSGIAIQSLQLNKQDHETRIRRLEDGDRRWAAAAVIVSAIVSTLLTFLGRTVWP